MSLPFSSEQARAWLCLLRCPGLGTATLRELIARHHSAETVVAACRDTNALPGAARAWLSAPDEQAIARDLVWLDAPGHHLVTCADDDYPVLLRDAQNPPAALFVDGDPAALWSPQIAIVGARSASASGLADARAFARAFAQAGNVVTSGLAEGIDGAAHGAALEAGGRTIAVLGTGPDRVYPKRHAALAASVAENGALVTEFPPGTAGRPAHFPQRNRIIAALALGTLVVEAGLRSGSLITARLAAEQGREVFALPGSIHSPLARGCHKLIRDGARLVETAGEVLESLSAVGAVLADGIRQRLAAEGRDADPDGGGSPEPNDPDRARLLAALDAAPCALDELSARTGLPASALSSMLLILELDGRVTREHGRYTRRA